MEGCSLMNPAETTRNTVLAKICAGSWTLPCIRPRGHDGECGPAVRAEHDRVTDDRATHSFPVWAEEEFCRCGAPAAHKVAEESGPDNFHPLTAYLCCEHFAPIGRCEGYPYDLAHGA